MGTLRGHAALQVQTNVLRDEVPDRDAQLAGANEVNTVLDEMIEELVAAAGLSTIQREAAFKDFNKLSRNLDVKKSVVRTWDNELKELRAFNPKKQKAQIKRITQRNAELSEMNDRNGKLIKQKREDIKGLVLELDKVKTDNGRLVMSLDDTCAMMNEQQQEKPLWSDDSWAVVGHNQAPKRIYIRFASTGEMRVFDLEQNGYIRSTPVPAYVTDEARGRLERYAEIEDQLNPYQEAANANA